MRIGFLRISSVPHLTRFNPTVEQNRPKRDTQMEKRVSVRRS